MGIAFLCETPVLPSLIIDTEVCMLVRAVCKTSIYELIPRHLFEGKFPAHFSEDFIYWYDTQAHHIGLCSRSDPLTGALGTEMSLTILSSAAVRSFDQLSEKNIDILSCLERLMPQRLFYPEHLQENLLMA